MSPAIISAIMIGAFLIIVFLGLPVTFALIAVSVLLLMVFVDPGAIHVVYVQSFKALTTDIYLAVPLFVTMAAALQYSGIGTALYDAMYKWFGGLRGGLAMGTIALCTLIAAMTGLSGTGIVSIGYLAYPEMMKRGYAKNMALGCIPAGSALGPIIPPSVLFVVLGAMTQVSVGKLFMGGVFPGLLMAFLFMAFIAFASWRNRHLAPAIPVGERATWQEKLVSLRGVVLPILLIVIVLGTIYAGITTATEAGGIGAFGALVCAAIYRKLTWNSMTQICDVALKISAMVLWIIVGGTSIAALMTMTKVSEFISTAIAGMTIGTGGILAIMMVIPFILGMIMDGMPIIMILVPIYMPIIWALNIDPLWFLLLFGINIVIGVVSPPYGLNLFYTKGISPEIKMSDVYRGVWPFVGIMLFVLALMILFPQIGVWLPNMMIK